MFTIFYLNGQTDYELKQKNFTQNFLYLFLNCMLDFLFSDKSIQNKHNRSNKCRQNSFLEVFFRTLNFIEAAYKNQLSMNQLRKYHIWFFWYLYHVCIKYQIVKRFFFLLNIFSSLWIQPKQDIESLTWCNCELIMYFNGHMICF